MKFNLFRMFVLGAIAFGASAHAKHVKPHPFFLSWASISRAENHKTTATVKGAKSILAYGQVRKIKNDEQQATYMGLGHVGSEMLANKSRADQNAMETCRKVHRRGCVVTGFLKIMFRK